MPSRRGVCGESVTGARLLVGALLSASGLHTWASRFRRCPQRGAACRLAPPDNEVVGHASPSHSVGSLACRSLLHMTKAGGRVAVEMARCSGSCAAFVLSMACSRDRSSELHDSSDIVRACVRSHESGIVYTRYTIRTVTVLVSHGSQFKNFSYTVPCGEIVTR